MLTWFRNNAKIFLIAIVVIFVGMIFLEWGRGGLDDVRPDNMVMGSVNGEGLEPAWYDAAHREVYATMENQMASMGYPNSESQLALMYNDINDAAFDLMVDRMLQGEYLRKLGWEPVRMSMAEDLLAAQLQLMGVQDPRGYMDEYRSDPNFNTTLMQLVSQADRSMFSMAVSLENMISADELEFMIQDAMTTVTARYIPFRSSPEMPSEEKLEEFYLANTELFTREPGSRIRFAVFSIAPEEEDLRISLSIVDSLAISGGGNPDTMQIIRAQLETITGWSIDMAPGDISEPFIAASMGQAGMQACHSVELLSQAPASDDSAGLSDTLTIVHWEVPLFPGRATVREAFWDIEGARNEILASQAPSFEDYQLLDYGEYLIDRGTAPSPEMPQAVISFATDTIWADSIGPVFYIPSFSGGYPALMVAKKLEEVPGGQVSYENALESNMILFEYYTRLQNEQALQSAEEALLAIRSSGMSLSEYAALDSLEVYDSQQFIPVSVRQWAGSEEASYRGFLGCSGLADASLTAAEYTVTGPFVNNGVAYLAEITSRTGAEIPENRAQLAGFYLSLQSGHNALYSERLMASLEDNAEIIDGRESYYSTMDSLRTAYAARQEIPE